MEKGKILVAMYREGKATNFLNEKLFTAKGEP
jgi:hypothetical protein